MTKERVLLVDDEPNVLEAYKLSLRKRFDVVTAQGGAEGLERLGADGPFPVVVSDLRMPGMDGVAFLRRARKRFPNTVRMMLTGNADIDAAMEAVNEGSVFRFMAKPCPADVLIGAIQAGVDQYRLVVAERDLLENTLRGAIKILTDVLSAMNPKAFSRATRARRLVKSLAAELGVERSWQWEIAAMISQVGCVTMPPELIEKAWSGRPLSSSEQRLFLKHPEIGAELISNVPRLEHIADIVRYQEKQYSGAGAPRDDVAGEAIPMGARVLHIALAYDRMLSAGVEARKALVEIEKSAERYDPRVLLALRAVALSEAGGAERTVPVTSLSEGMILAQDIVSKNGSLLVANGEEVTASMKFRLRHLEDALDMTQGLRVVVPKGADGKGQT